MGALTFDVSIGGLNGSLEAHCIVVIIDNSLELLVMFHDVTDP